jgi:hypothetical protein
LRVTFQNTLLLLGAFALTACSDGALMSGGKGDSKSKKDEEDEGADEPVPVSGSYLTCDWMEDQKTEPGQTTTIGCTVNDKDGNAFPRDGYNYQLSLFDDSKKQVDMATTDTQASSRFHKTALLPSEYNSTGYLLMTMRQGNEPVDKWTIATTDIGTNVGLGKETEGTASVVTADIASTIPLKSVTRHGFWNGENGGFSLDRNVLSSAFCDKGGKVRTTISDEWKKLIKDSYGISTSIDTTESTTHLITGPGETNTCFAEFSVDFKGTDWAHASGDGQCFFLSSGHHLYIYSKPKIDDPNFTLENLKKFAEARKCQ